MQSSVLTAQGCANRNIYVRQRFRRRGAMQVAYVHLNAWPSLKLCALVRIFSLLFCDLLLGLLRWSVRVNERCKMPGKVHSTLEEASYSRRVFLGSCFSAIAKKYLQRLLTFVDIRPNAGNSTSLATRQHSTTSSKWIALYKRSSAEALSPRRRRPFALNSRKRRPCNKARIHRLFSRRREILAQLATKQSST